MRALLSFLLGVQDLSGLRVERFSAQCLPLAPAVWIILLGVAGVIVLAAAYRHLRGGASRRARWGLLAVRLLLFALVLCCLVHPIVAVQAKRFVKGVVPILIDSSQSMTVRDVKGESRFRVAEQVAKQVVATLSNAHEPRVYVFSEDVAPQSLSPESALPSPRGRHTDLAAALTGVSRDLAGAPLDAMVLITDGGNNYGQDPIETAAKLGIAVFAVGIGGHAVGADLQIADVQANPFPLRGDVATIRVTLRATSLKTAQSGKLYLKRQGKILAARNFRIESESGAQTVALDCVPDRRGPMELTLEAIADFADPVPENNRRTLHLAVAADKIRVLMLDGRPRWEYGFIRRALVADPHLSVMSETRVAEDLVYKQADAYTTLEKGLFPRSLRELCQFDVLVIGDVARTTFAIPQLFDIESFVAEQGGGLVFLGGRHTLGAKQRYTKAPVAKLLPFVYTGNEARRDDESGMILTDDGEVHPVTRLHEDPNLNAERWRKLGPVWGYWEVTRPRPSARVLARVQPLGQDEPGTPAILAHRYGKGRVLVFAADTSWRWSLSAGTPEGEGAAEPPNYHCRFWKNAVRWAAGEITDPDERTFVRTDRAAYSVGDTVHILARVLGPEYRPAAAARVLANVRLGAELITSLQLEPDAGRRGFHRGSFRPDREGTYTIAAESVLEGDEEPGRAECTITVEVPCREFTDVALDETLLSAIAKASGGEFVRAEDAAALPARLKSSRPALASTFEIDLLDAPLTWIIFVTLLLGEWIFRKTRGLA